MTTTDFDLEALQKQNEFYKKRIEELSGDNLRYDIAVSGLRHELRQRRKSFALLSELQRTIGSQTELSDIFAAIAPVAAQMGGQATIDDELWQIPEPENPLSVISFNGMNDTRVPYDGGRPLEGNAHVYSWMSTNESISFWVEHNECNTTPQRNISESGNIIIDTYSEGLNSTGVKLVTIVDGTHSWPGGKKGWVNGPEPTKEISATDMMWDFFKEHPKQ